MQTRHKLKTVKNQPNIFELLKNLTDHRRGQGQRYEYPTLVLMTIMGIMSGAKSERAISRFVKNNEKDLVEQLKIERGEAPKRHVFVNLIQELDFKSLEKIFYNWSKEFVEIKKNDWVSIDGKAIKGTSDAQRRSRDPGWDPSLPGKPRSSVSLFSGRALTRRNENRAVERESETG